MLETKRVPTTATRAMIDAAADYLDEKQRPLGPNHHSFVPATFRWHEALERAIAAAPLCELPDADSLGELVLYTLQDETHNRLTPRVVDIAYSAFMRARGKNDEDGGPTDWFNDTKPMVMAAIAKVEAEVRTLLPAPGSVQFPQEQVARMRALAEGLGAHAGGMDRARIAELRTILAGGDDQQSPTSSDF